MVKLNCFFLFLFLFAFKQMGFAETTIEFDGATLLQSPEDTVVNDSLVQNLSCKKLTKQNVFTSLQPNAFAVDRQIPLQNWNANSLGQCWSLSLTQRELFYLLRFGAVGVTNDISFVLQLADIAPNRKVVGTTAPCLGCRAGIFSALKSAGIEKRIEAKQMARFYDPSNYDMILSNRERSLSEDAQSMQKILGDLKMGLMPLIIVRAELFMQHAVLVKSAQMMGPDSYNLVVYDSNHPRSENSMIFANGRFFAPEILKGLTHQTDQAVGVFLKDQTTMYWIQEAAFLHYQSLCKIRQ
jgi:hypothetical protein